MLLLSHPLGNANARQAALALEEAGLLDELWTCLHWTPGHRAERWLPGAVVRELGRRSFPPEVRHRVRTAPVREAGRLLAARVPGTGWLTRHERGWCSVDAVFRGLDRAVARRLRAGARGASGSQINAVYAYEDGAAATFRAAARAGVRRIYDLPIGYWRVAQTIFAEEAEREPAWAATLTGRADSACKLARKDEELAAAEAVIVASSFTRQTLAAAPFRLSAPVYVIPYGAPPSDESVRTSAPGKLRVLFAGSLGQRKGLSYLLEAVRRFGPRVELTLLGSRTVENCPPLEAALRAHRWIASLPHARVLEEMARQDVLVFPSLFEGFGLVILEAMSRGLPVIATAHTAGPDVITEGEDGFIVPIRSVDSIAEKLALLLDSPDRLAEMRRAARRKAESFTWETYRRRLAGCVLQLLDPSACAQP